MDQIGPSRRGYTVDCRTPAASAIDQPINGRQFCEDAFGQCFILAEVRIVGTRAIADAMLGNNTIDEALRVFALPLRAVTSIQLWSKW